MSDSPTGRPSRRSVLRSLGAVGAGAGLLRRGAAREAVPERRIVGAETKRAAEQAKRRADMVVRELDFGDVGRAVVGEFPPASEVELEANSEVRYVEEESEVKLLGDPEETQVVPWGIEEIGAADLHEEGTTGAGAHIAIIDSGVDSDHPDLAANLGEGKAVVSCDGACRRDWDDDHNHGTHVAGIADATSNETGVVGVSTEAILHSVKVMSADGSGDTSTIAEGIKWAADKGYDVANMSIGATSPSEVMHDAVRYADDKGMLMVAAAGNEEPDEHTVHFPGAFPEVICVGAISKDGDMYVNSLEGDQVELVAPGDDIPSCVRGGYDVYSGTSMATPHVTGAAALLIGDGLSRGEVRRRLRDTARDLGHDDDEQGYGLVDPASALGSGGAPRDVFDVLNHGATAVGERSATLNAELVGLGDHPSATVGFEYWVPGRKALTTLTVEGDERSTPGTFSATVENLDRETTYAYVAYAVDGDERVTTEPREFATVDVDDGPERSVVAKTDPAGDVEEDEAELRGRVTEMTGVDELRVYFEYWPAEADDPEPVRLPVDVLDGPDEFEEDAEDLESGTTYAARVECVADDGTTYDGGTVEFTTAGSPDDGGDDVAAAVVTDGVDDVEEDEAELHGRVIRLDGVEEVEVGFEYWVEGEESTRSRTDTDVLDDVDDFDEDAEDLAAGTTYVARAWCVADDGTTATGNAVTFTTAGASGDGEAAAMSTDGVIDVDTDEAELVGRVTRLDGTLQLETYVEYWAKGRKSETYTRMPVDVVDDPDDFDEDLEDLDAGTTYVARALGVADDGTTVDGGRVEFTTRSED